MAYFEGKLNHASTEAGGEHTGYVLETERVIEGSPVLHTIVRATQFYDLVLMAVRALTRLPVVPVPKGLVASP